MKFIPAHTQEQKHGGAPRIAVTAESSQHGIHHAPSVNDVATRAFFNYTNRGSQHGNDVQQWLEAEAQLRAEQKFAHEAGK